MLLLSKISIVLRLKYPNLKVVGRTNYVVNRGSCLASISYNVVSLRKVWIEEALNGI